MLTFVRCLPALRGPGLWERAARGGAGAGPVNRSSSGTDLQTRGKMRSVEGSDGVMKGPLGL